MAATALFRILLCSHRMLAANKIDSGMSRSMLIRRIGHIMFIYSDKTGYNEFCSDTAEKIREAA